MLHFAPALDNMEATILLCISFLLACMVPKSSEVLQDSHCTSLSQPTQSRHCPFSHDVFGSHLQVSGKHPATTTGSEMCVTGCADFTSPHSILFMLAPGCTTNLISVDPWEWQLASQISLNLAPIYIHWKQVQSFLEVCILGNSPTVDSRLEILIRWVQKV